MKKKQNNPFFLGELEFLKKKQNNPFFLGELERLAFTLLDVFIGGFFSQCFSVRRFFSQCF